MKRPGLTLCVFALHALAPLAAAAEPAPAADPAAADPLSATSPAAAPPAAAPPAAAPPAAAPPAAAPPPASSKPADAGTLQDPDQLSIRYSAYSLPKGQFAFDTNVLGIGGGDVVAALGAAYGVGAGLQVSANLAHMSVGLFNANLHWQFVDTRYFALGASAGAWYGHGSWVWIARGLTKEVLSKLDLLQVPVELTASSLPTTWLELDLMLRYTYSNLIGAEDGESSFFSDAQLNLNQFAVHPGARLFVSDNTAIEFSAKLPFKSSTSGNRFDVDVPFSKTWTLEVGLRSRLAPGLFATMRTHYAAVADSLYGARLYPSFGVEFRP